jgi:hypothetical protein
MAAVAAFLLAGLLYPYRHGHVARVTDAALGVSDFGAFYCAALVRREGADPYLLAPLKACEVERVYGPSGSTYEQHGGVDPAPLPPYALALFEPFTLLPYRAAGLLWLAILLAATFATAPLLARLANIPNWVALAFLGAGASNSFVYGQTEPVLTLSLVGAAVLLRSGRTVWAVAALAPTVIEPHLALPPMLSLLVWARGARGPVAIVAAGFAVLSLAYGGWAFNLEYLSRVLPAAGYSELTDPIQYGLSAVLWALGAPVADALAIGALQYLALGIGSVVAAGLLARRIGRPALVLLPAAAAVLGGVYIHATQMPSALPFALYLASTAPEWSALAWLGAILITLHWPALVESRLTLPLTAAVIFGAAGSLGKQLAPSLRAGVACAAFAAYLASGIAMRHIPATPLRALGPPSDVATSGFDTQLASTQAAVEARMPPYIGPTPWNLAGRTPTWLGLILIVGAGLTASLRRTNAENPQSPSLS